MRCLSVAEVEKYLHIHKKDLRSLEEAMAFATTTIKEERLGEYSLNIAEMTGQSGRCWYDVQIEGKVKSGEPDQERGG